MTLLRSRDYYHTKTHSYHGCTYRVRIHVLMLPETQITSYLLPTSPLVDSQTLVYIEKSPKLGDIKAG